MSYRCAKQSHHAITGKLINGPFVLVNLLHKDLETPIHDLVDSLWIEFLRHRRVIDYISKKDGDYLPLAFDGAPCGKDLICEVFRCIGFWVRIGFWGRLDCLPKIGTALIAKFGFVRVFKLAYGAIHFINPIV